jgi:hypothetical protein
VGRSIPDVIPADSTLQFCSAVRARILSFADTPQGIDLVRVTMLQAFPQVIHLKRILDFGEGQVMIEVRSSFFIRHIRILNQKLLKVLLDSAPREA